MSLDRTRSGSNGTSEIDRQINTERMRERFKITFTLLVSTANGQLEFIPLEQIFPLLVVCCSFLLLKKSVVPRHFFP